MGRFCVRCPIFAVRMIGGDNSRYFATGGLNNCESHSRYFSDELGAQIFYIITEQMFAKGA